MLTVVSNRTIVELKYTGDQLGHKRNSYKLLIVPYSGIENIIL